MELTGNVFAGEFIANEDSMERQFSNYVIAQIEFRRRHR